MCKVLLPTSNARSVFHIYTNAIEVIDWKNGRLGMDHCDSLVPRGFWQDRDNKVKFFKWLEERLQLKSPEDWYKLQVSSSHCNNQQNRMEILKKSLE